MILALLCGAFIGAVLGFVGAGGAMLSVPILLYIFDFTPTQATTAALAVVFLAALAGVIPKLKSGDVLFREALSVWGIGFISNVGGASLAKHLSDVTILSGFAGVMIVAGFSMLRGPVKDRPEKRMKPIALISTSLIIGAMTGIFGIGGGFLAIPVLVLFYHTPQMKAAGTSLLIITLNCLTSFIAHHSVWSQVKWHTPILMGAMAIFVSAIASHYASRANARILRITFAYLLFTIAAFTLIRTWFFA
jgi:uncharacterized membrane protein YfcA